MVIIKPFRAVILNPELQHRDRFICPVYDTINGASFERYGQEKNNVIHITTHKNGVDRADFIEGAKKNMDRFFNDGILIQREQPALYIYGIRYSLSEELLGQVPSRGKRDTYFAFGLIGLVKVEPLGKGNIVGHERIYEKNTLERYDLMKACGMNFSPIVSEYSILGHEINNILEGYLGFKRPELTINKDRPPLVDLSLNGVRHLLWEITDIELIQQICGLLADKKILILDGHHRYTAADNLRRRDGVDFTMMMFMEGGDRALVLLPWHRCIKHFDKEMMKESIQQNFDVIWTGKTDDEEFYSVLRSKEDNYDVRIGVFNGEGFSIIKARTDSIKQLSDALGETIGLDYISLNEWMIKPCVNGNVVDNVSFTESVREAARKVATGEFGMAFLMRSLTIEEVEHKAHREMKNFPQKSTLFLPKVAEGILMRRIHD